jgi:drug/metabolite transporter (DMT)-like permease
MRLVGHLVTDPLWLLGSVSILGSFVCQAIALNHGQLSVVQPLLVTELVFTLVLRRVWLRQSIAMAAWASAGLTCLGLGVFILEAEPQGGMSTPASHEWVWAVLGCGVAAAGLVLLAQFGSPPRRAALLGAAAAVVWALEATFIKSATDNLTTFGVSGALQRWPVYALAAGGILGFLMEQSALHVGPLSYSQPAIVIVDPMVSILLGVVLFEEHFTTDALTLALASASFVCVCVGVVFLTRTAPAEDL